MGLPWVRSSAFFGKPDGHVCLERRHLMASGDHPGRIPRAEVLARNTESRRLWAEGWRQIEIARRYGLSKATVSRICTNRPQPNRPNTAPDPFRGFGRGIVL
jgi:DNA invertase Pin-like site-specific DNA recombinase